MTNDPYARLFAGNTPSAFWKPLQPIADEVWATAERAAAAGLPPELRPAGDEDTSALALSESLFGPDRYKLNGLKTIYYAVARPLMPTWVRPLLRKIYHPGEDEGSLLGWPTEDRFVRYQLEVIGQVMDQLGQDELAVAGLWPAGHQSAFVLTHDVEAQAGYDFVREVMDLEASYGFRSSFNFVPEAYAVGADLLDEMRARGFEVGVHGLKHDGRLFSSREVFMARAAEINEKLAEWRAVGYRSPMTHRNPDWMQALAIQYDLSFFDTDPYEPMAGGTMSIWPFQLGNFIELPYTLMQDHRYLEVLEERSPDLWLQKADFVRANYGMVLLNSHPDYLLKPGALPVYEQLLSAMRDREGVWAALPKEVAAWWRRRGELHDGPQANFAELAQLDGGTVWHLVRVPGGVQLRQTQPVA
jgi:hypothetical protein